MNKIHHEHCSACIGYLYIMGLINTQTMEHILLLLYEFDIISYIINFHSVDPYRITKSIWIWKWSYFHKKSSNEVNIQVF